MIIGSTGAAKTIRANPIPIEKAIAKYFIIPVNPNILNYNLDYI
jgi:hypothetical protein